MIVRTVKYIWKKLFPPKLISFREQLGNNLSASESTIFNNGCNFHFNSKYNRDVWGKCIDIGEKCLITASFIFENNSGSISIGNNVYIGGASLITKTSIKIGNNVTLAWGIFIYDHDAHSTDWNERQYDNEKCYNDFLTYNKNLNVTKDWSVVNSKEIIIEDNVWVGFDVLILKGVKIGKGAVIGAKSVVTKDVPPFTVYAGNPAVFVKKLKEY